MSDDTDEILSSERSDENKILSLARLCRHRYKCMEQDADRIQRHKVMAANDLCIIQHQNELIKILQGIPIWTRLIVCLNRWAKS